MTKTLDRLLGVTQLYEVTMKDLQTPFNIPGGGNKPIDDKKDGSLKIPLPNKSKYGPKS